MSPKHSTFRAHAVPVTPITVGVTVGMVLLLIAAFAPVPAVWVLVLYVAGMAAATAGVLVQRRRVRR
ncbi:hypothetical protein [Williamsia muralis]|uniref:hypothetical protein n=1 Tax=Williamsia marianensis TaxID=85044 RepID=UPI0038135FA3